MPARGERGTGQQRTVGGDRTLPAAGAAPAWRPPRIPDRAALGGIIFVLFSDTYAHMLQEIDADAAAKLEAAIRGRARRAAD